MGIFLKNNDVWNESRLVHVKHNNIWKNTKHVWIKDGGTWKKVHSSLWEFIGQRFATSLKDSINYGWIEGVKTGQFAIGFKHGGSTFPDTPPGWTKLAEWDDIIFWTYQTKANIILIYKRLDTESDYLDDDTSLDSLFVVDIKDTLELQLVSGLQYGTEFNVVYSDESSATDFTSFIPDSKPRPLMWIGFGRTPGYGGSVTFYTDYYSSGSYYFAGLSLYQRNHSKDININYTISPPSYSFGAHAAIAHIIGV